MLPGIQPSPREITIDTWIKYNSIKNNKNDTIQRANLNDFAKMDMVACEKLSPVSL
nr:hypothetical protein [uncultured Desulfobacter sp.]